MIGNIVSLSDVCDISSSKRIFFSDYTTSGVPFYRSKEIIEIESGQQISEPLYISEDKYDSIKSKFGAPVSGDMLLTSVGTIGIPYIVRHDDFFYFKDGNLTWFRNFSDALNSCYLYYWIKSQDGQGTLYNLTIGSSQKALTISALKQLKINLPSRIIQDKIVSILSAYDDLIANNQKQIKLLEEAAQRLYKEWFIDLHFPGYENCKIVDGVPEGWVYCKLGEAIEFNPSVILKKGQQKVVVPMAAISTNSMILDRSQFTYTTDNSGTKFQNGDTLLARITPCLENGKTAFVTGLEDNGALGSTEFIVMRSTKLNPYMVYLLARTYNFRQHAINSMKGADGRQRVQVDKLIDLDYLLPNIQTIDAFESIVKPLFSKIQILQSQVGLSQEARDRLLPKLMSGEIEV